jgi:hypothetical protein
MCQAGVCRRSLSIRKPDKADRPMQRVRKYRRRNRLWRSTPNLQTRSCVSCLITERFDLDHVQSLINHHQQSARVIIWPRWRGASLNARKSNRQLPLEVNARCRPINKKSTSTSRRTKERQESCVTRRLRVGRSKQMVMEKRWSLIKISRAQTADGDSCRMGCPWA